MSLFCIICRLKKIKEKQNRKTYKIVFIALPARDGCKKRWKTGREAL